MSSTPSRNTKKPRQVVRMIGAIMLTTKKLEYRDTCRSSAG